MKNNLFNNVLSKYSYCGDFSFQTGDTLKDQSKDVPDLPGIYYILRVKGGKSDLVYVGKSGTMKQDGNFKKQFLRKRINNKQEGMYREQYFNQKINQFGIDSLEVFWFVTYDNNHRDIPCFVEGQLIQDYFNINSRLPEWNKEF